MRRNELPDACFSILPSTGQLIIIKKGESGYYPSEWDTGNREENRDIASSHNESRGISDMQESAKLQNDIQREISPQERKQPEQNRPVR